MKRLLERFCVWYLRKRWGGQVVCIPLPITPFNVPNFMKPNQQPTPIREEK